MSDFPLPPLLTPSEARELRIKELLERIESTAPAWSKVPPWIAEKMFERAEQRELFTKNGGQPGKEKPANETGEHNEFTRTK